MSSPVIAPVPPRRRSLLGPFVLIAVGVVFLLTNLGMLHGERLAQWFAHYWPLLLILGGVLKLIEHQQAKRDGAQASGIGAGGVFLFLLIIVFGLIASQVSQHWGMIRDNINIDGANFPLFGQSFSYDDQLERALPAGGELRVNNEHGVVNVNVGDGDQIKVIVRKTVRAEKQQDADKYNAQTKPEFIVSGTIVTLNAKTEAAGDHGVTADLDITLPRKANLEVTSRRGDVTVTGRDGDVAIHSIKGGRSGASVNIEDVKGNATLNLEGSAATIAKVSGDVALDGRADDVSISDVKGSVKLNGEFMESVKLARVDKSVAFRSSRTEMEFAKLEGDLELDSSDLRASNLNGPMRLTTRSKDISLTDFSGDLKLKNSNGGVEVRVKTAGNLQIDNDKGDVEVTVPDRTPFTLEASAQGGDIDTDFEEIKVEKVNDTAKGVGTVGKNGPKFVLNSQHSSIRVQKGTTTQAAPALPAAPARPALPGKAVSKSKPVVTEN